MTDRTLDWTGWVGEIAKVHGIPTVLLGLFMLAGWRGVEWSASHVIEPLVTKQISLIGKLENHLERQFEEMLKMERKMADNDRILIDNQVRIVASQEKIVDQQKTIIELIKHIGGIRGTTEP